MIYPLKEKNAVQNFLKMFEACIGDFRHPKFKEWRIVQKILGNNKNFEEVNDGEATERSSGQRSSAYAQGPGNTRKQSFYKFAESDARMQHALRNRERWIECFFIQSLVWAYASILKEG